MKQDYLAKAFLSCSLRPEDKPFVDWIARILHRCRIQPFGTVGRYQASPENPVQLMKRAIKQADFVVIVATKRYLTQDAHNGKASNTLSEMIHTEAGMAFAQDKPVVVFVQEGTQVGNFLPSITQYIILNGTWENLYSQKHLIESLLTAALQKSQENKQRESQQELGKLIMGGLAFYGGLKLLEQED